MFYLSPYATAFYNKVALDILAVKGDVDLSGEVNSNGYITLTDAILSLNKE